MSDVAAAHRLIGHTIRYLSAIANQATEGILLMDLDGIVRFINVEWANIHGYTSPRQLVGKHIRTFFTEIQMRTDMGPLIEETKRRGMLVGPIYHMRRDGTAFPTQTKLLLLKNRS